MKDREQKYSDYQEKKFKDHFQNLIFVSYQFLVLKNLFTMSQVLRICLILLFYSLSSVELRKYDVCSFANEIQSKGVLRNDIHKHVCVAFYKGNFKTDFNSTKAFGIYAINEEWCKDDGACNIKCSDLLDDNLFDDVQCAEKIIEQKSVKAWGEEISCNHLRATVDQCFD